MYGWHNIYQYAGWSTIQRPSIRSYPELKRRGYFIMITPKRVKIRIKVNLRSSASMNSVRARFVCPVACPWRMTRLCGESSDARRRQYQAACKLSLQRRSSGNRDQSFDSHSPHRCEELGCGSQSGAQTKQGNVWTSSWLDPWIWPKIRGSSSSCNR